MMEWFDIRKKLPKKNTWCLVDCGAAGLHISQYDENGYWSPNYSGCCSNSIRWNLQFVKYWMPLPELPKSNE